jgi:hypothetical protein
MPIVGLDTESIDAYNGSVTVEVNFSPHFVAAQISLSYVSGQGLHHAGIVKHRFRQTPTGPDITVNHSWYYPNALFINNGTSVTYKLTLGSGQAASALANTFFWA